ncbi:hypothetical protein ACQPZP_06705 [Spirillospora sp. CA-142024]|uniref:hypothetical protein n=1 Tax=Spirillospora sp. CA-142024 TaxID=3240036 RepID=UPI003D907F2C
MAATDGQSTGSGSEGEACPLDLPENGSGEAITVDTNPRGGTSGLSVGDISAMTGNRDKE